MLELKNLSKVAAGEVHIAPTSFVLAPGTLNVLLGPTASGKTSLLRLMAGLDRPTAGSIHMHGRDVTGVAVRRRNVAMVYQQFINYPAMTVFENIASPLRVAKVKGAEITRRVHEAATLLKLTPYLDRRPLELSGGQQQRAALARAIVKGADLVLLDEPLANLDYKLREDLRAELPRLFAATGAILVYATTEPNEALLLGGQTFCLSQGRVVQSGPAAEVYRNPVSLTAARTYSDPPLNVAQARKAGDSFLLAAGASLPAPPRLPDGDYVIGVRPHHLRLSQGGGLPGKVQVVEITGSESFIHLEVAGQPWVMLAPGVQAYPPGQSLHVQASGKDVLVFTPDGVRASASLDRAA